MVWRKYSSHSSLPRYQLVEMTEEKWKLQGVRQLLISSCWRFDRGGKFKQKWRRSTMSKGRSVQRLESEGPRNMLIWVGFLLPHLRGLRAESSTVEKVVVFYVSLHFFVFDSHLVGVLCEAAFYIIFGNVIVNMSKWPWPMLVKQFTIK